MLSVVGMYVPARRGGLGDPEHLNPIQQKTVDLQMESLPGSQSGKSIPPWASKYKITENKANSKMNRGT